MTNHPLIDFIKEKLKIKYNIHFEGISDLTDLLKTYGYKVTEEPNELFSGMWKFTRVNNDMQYSMEINENVFDEEKKTEILQTQ